MNKNPYESCDAYDVFIYETKEEWKKGRTELHGIGGSDSAAAIGESIYKTNRDLWLIKTGRRQARDINENPAVRYGTMAEHIIREQFSLDNEGKIEVHYKENCILKSRKNPCMLYSPDGLLIENGTGKVGVLEIKTSSPMSYSSWQEWNEKIPQQYFIQVLHGMSVINADFAILRAYLRKQNGDAEVRNYRMERDEFQSDIEYVEKKVTEFWRSVEDDEEPPLVITTKGLNVNGI